MKFSIILLILVLFIACNSETSDETTKIERAKSIVELEPASGEEVSIYERAYNKSLELFDCNYKELKVSTTFGDAYVIEAGEDNTEVLLLLHGMNATSTMWYPNIKELSKKYKVYAIDFLMEPGKSEQRVEITSTASIMRWYTEIIDSLNLDSFSIVGASRGGWLGVNIALKHPDRVSKLILLSPAQTFKWIKIGKDLFSNLAYTINPKRRKLRKSLKTMSSNVDNIEQDYIDQYYMSTKRASISKLFIEMTPFTDEELQSLKMPVMVLIGDKDFINNKKSLTQAKRYIPNVYVEVIKKAGHFLSFDQAEIVNTKIISFLEKK